MLLLIARFTALVLVLQAELPFGRHLPHFEWLDGVGTQKQWNAALRGSAVAGTLLLFTTRYVRVACALVGGAMLLSLIGCRPCLSVAHTYVGCLLLVIALSSHRSGTRLVQAQIVIVYAGACLNKALDVDWWNGAYFEAWLIGRHGLAAYAWLAEQLPPLLLSQAMGIVSILAEAWIVVGLLRRRWVAPALLVAVGFHVISMLVVNKTFGPFVPVMLISYLAFWGWPERLEARTDRPVWPRVWRWLDPDANVRWQPGNELEVRGAETDWTRAAARRRILWATPAVLLLAAVPFASAAGVWGAAGAGLLVLLAASAGRPPQPGRASTTMGA